MVRNASCPADAARWLNPWSDEINPEKNQAHSGCWPLLSFALIYNKERQLIVQKPQDDLLLHQLLEISTISRPERKIRSVAGEINQSIHLLFLSTQHSA